MHALSEEGQVSEMVLWKVEAERREIDAVYSTMS
jgi:hypothetical protein